MDRFSAQSRSAQPQTPVERAKMELRPKPIRFDSRIPFDLLPFFLFQFGVTNKNQPILAQNATQGRKNFTDNGRLPFRAGGATVC
jgi:hypothetical protein